MAARILLVDDDATLLALLMHALARVGHAVTGSGSAESAEVLLRDHAFDVLITDLDLPRASGAWLLRRAREHNPELPVIVITGNLDARDAVPELRQADAILYKPFDLSTLLRQITRLSPDRPHPATQAREAARIRRLGRGG